MVVEKNVPLQPCNTFGIAARAQTLVRVHSSADVRAVLADEALKGRLIGQGAIPAGNTPAQFAKLIADDRQRYATIIRERKITLD